MRFRFFLGLLALLCLGLMPLAAQPAQSTPDFTALETVITEQLQAQNTPGIAIAIVHQGAVIYRAGFGVRSIEGQEPVTPDTLFRIGSTTKPMTALGLLMLAEDGRVALDAPISTYLPDFALGDDITVRHLLSHTAGLSDEAQAYGSLDADALAESMGNFTSASQFAPAGQVHSYSNPGFNIAGRVIEVVTGQYYADYMEKVVFRALGLKRTTLYPNIAITYPVAIGYEPSLFGRLNVTRPNTDNVAEYPSGFAYSSVNDLTNLINFILMEGQPILGEVWGKEMLTPVVPAISGGFEYGLGVMIGEYRGTPMIGHDGKINGYTALLQTLPAHQFGVVILGNNIAFDPTPIFDAAVDSVLTLPVPDETADIVQTGELDDYVGTYALKNPAGDVVISVRVTLENGGLTAAPDGQPRLDLIPISGINTFEAHLGGQPLGVTLTFMADEQGTFTYLSVGYRVATRQPE